MHMAIIFSFRDLNLAIILALELLGFLFLTEIYVFFVVQLFADFAASANHGADVNIMTNLILILNITQTKNT